MLLYSTLLVSLLLLVELTYGHDGYYGGYHVGVQKSMEGEKDHYGHRDIIQQVGQWWRCKGWTHKYVFVQKFLFTSYNENIYPNDFFELNCSVPICEGPLTEIYCTEQLSSKKSLG